ncbi:MAG TPA: hypothetical protein VJC16_04925 [Candidatus Nanoarchaeia archaeon]|nr:hypothetical protein [Candidatus Nanoarchaeia archaeon]
MDGLERDIYQLENDADEMRTLCARGNRWGITFLKGGAMSELEYCALFLQATIMYLKKENRRKVQTDTLEGTITTERKYGVLGTFGGQRFDAWIENAQGIQEVRFLVSELTYVGAFPYSPN